MAQQAPAISISLYVIKVTERRKRDNLQVDKFDGVSDLYKVICSALEEYQGNSVEIKGGSRQVYITNDFEQKGRVLSGLVEVGNSGYSASIKDIKTGKENYKQKVSDAHMIPLYVRFWIPKKEKFGIAAFQHFGDAGCKSSIDSIIANYFREKYEGYTITLRQALPKQYAEKALNEGDVKEFTFIQHGVPQDIASKYGGDALPPGTGSVAVSIRAGRGMSLGWTGWARQAIMGKSKKGGAIEIDAFKNDDFRVRVSIKGKDRTLKMGDFLQMNSRIDVSDAVDLGADGHPKLQSISDVCEVLAAELASELD